MGERSTIEVQPVHVVAVGAASLAGGLLASLGYTYHQSSKALVKEGIDPRVRARVLPAAFAALTASTIVTGLVGVGGWYLLRQQQLLVKDSAELPTLEVAYGLVSEGVKGFWRDTMQSRRKDDTTQ